MLNFTQFLNEVGEAYLPFKYNGLKDDLYEPFHSYTFPHKGGEYEMGIVHHLDDSIPHASVWFDYTSPFHSEPTMGVTGHSGTSAVKVLSTVHNIVKHHLSKHPDVKEVHFTSDRMEPSRVKLYSKYAKKHGGRTADAYYDTLHIVPAKSYRGGHNISESGDAPVRIILGTPKGEQAQRFLGDFAKDSSEHPFNPAARILHGSIVHASRDGNHVHIHDIQTLDPKSGSGTKALKHLTALADKHGIKLNLFAKAYSNRPEHIRSTPKLIKWYEKHGFHHDEPDYDPDYGSDMTYYPK